MSESKTYSDDIICRCYKCGTEFPIEEGIRQMLLQAIPLKERIENVEPQARKHLGGATTGAIAQETGLSEGQVGDRMRKVTKGTDIVSLRRGKGEEPMWLPEPDLSELQIKGTTLFRRAEGDIRGLLDHWRMKVVPLLLKSDNTEHLRIRTQYELYFWVFGAPLIPQRLTPQLPIPEKTKLLFEYQRREDGSLEEVTG